jgi:hypothetical protein
MPLVSLVDGFKASRSLITNFPIGMVFEQGSDSELDEFVIVGMRVRITSTPVEANLNRLFQAGPWKT